MPQLLIKERVLACGAVKSKVILEKPTTFLEDEKRITPIEIRSRLEKIPSEHLPLFGFNPDVFRPEWMILTLSAA